MNHHTTKMHDPFSEAASNLEAIRFDRPSGTPNATDEVHRGEPVPRSATEAVDPRTMFTEEKIALIREVVPRTLRSLFVLRMLLCGVASVLALCKVALVPPLSKVFLDISQDIAAGLDYWMHAADLVVSGLLAMTLALVVATFFIQARIQSQVDREIAEV